MAEALVSTNSVPTPQSLANDMKNWLQSPQNEETREVLHTKIYDYLHSNKEFELQKIKLGDAPPDVQKEMKSLDDAVDDIQNQLKKSRKKKPRNTLALLQTQLDDAMEAAETYSDANFVASKHFPSYRFVEDGGGEEEPDDNGDVYIPKTDQDKQQEDLMMRLKEKRDLAARATHELWHSSPEKMRQAASIAHQLHRDYLRLAFRPGRGLSKPTPIPRKLIDKSAPPSFIEKTKPLAELLAQKEAAEKALTGNNTQETRNALNDIISRLRHATDIFWVWAQDNLSCAVEEGWDHTNYKFIPDGHDEPISGGPIPDIKLTISQLNRLQQQLQVVKSNKTTVTPFLFSSAVVVNMAKVKAYRGHLLAVYISPGCYRLVSMSEQFFWTPSDLAADTSIYNAGNARLRRLRGCKELPRKEKLELLQNCRGIVGVAHNGYHSLNMDSAQRNGRRIGDCMIEVAWQDGVNSWETRTDWRSFRGKKLADDEIYIFAKEHDNGEIPRYIPRKRELLIGSSSKIDSSGKRNIRNPGIMEYSDSEDDGTAPEDYSDWDI
jgi:hypothetical protein